MRLGVLRVGALTYHSIVISCNCQEGLLVKWVIVKGSQQLCKAQVDYFMKE